MFFNELSSVFYLDIDFVALLVLDHMSGLFSCVVLYEDLLRILLLLVSGKFIQIDAVVVIYIAVFVDTNIV